MDLPDFVHLHVASAWSLRHGVAQPKDLVQRAAAQGQGALALTDRDGLYGAVRFVQACQEAGIDPVLGVDLAVRSGAQPAGFRHTGARSVRTPVRGGAFLPDHPRITVLGGGRGMGLAPGAGWGALCELVTATHLAGERGEPLTTPALIASQLRSDGPDALRVLLGPDSDVGRALRTRRTSSARELLDAWREQLGAAVVVEVVHHGGPAGSPASRAHAQRMWGLAVDAGVPVVLTAAVRHVDPEQAMTLDVLDAARRGVALDERHLDRVTTAGHLADTPTMWRAAQELAEGMGGTAYRAADLFAVTTALAEQCLQDPRADLGIGGVHLPEPAVLGLRDAAHAQEHLAQRCEAAIGLRYPGASEKDHAAVRSRLAEELAVVRSLGYATYFMTVASVCDLIRERGARVAARGSGAGSLVNYLLGISGVEPLRHGLLMERFCTPLRAQLPDIDIDVESARRLEIYQAVLDKFGGRRVTCVSMMETYKVRHAVRDVAAALGLPPAEADTIATAFPHIRARDARAAVRDLPELRRLGLDTPRMQRFLSLVEGLDGLPRHIALHPCGVLLSDTGLLRRTPVEASWLGFPMSQFDKDDVETLGLLKLDILGIRMQSAMAHAVAEISRVEGARVELDWEAQPPGAGDGPVVGDGSGLGEATAGMPVEHVPLDDPETFALIQSARTLGCFQIESPGQRELIGKFGPETFEDIIIDISLFRPGPVKSDMVHPFLMARQGWQEPEYLHPTLTQYLRSTQGVVVFHEQILQIVHETTGVSLAQADEVRRAMGNPAGQAEVEDWWRPAAAARGYRPADIDRIWDVLASFASFGFCKAHAAAFALPTFQSTWLKAHHPAAFYAGVLTHDPGMYPKRLILDDARNFGVTVLSLDVNASGEHWMVDELAQGNVMAQGDVAAQGSETAQGDTLTKTPGRVEAALTRIRARGSAYGIRVPLTEVKGISEAEVCRIVAGQPYESLADFWARTRTSRPVVERMVVAGGFDALHGISGGDIAPRGQVTRRDLLLHIADLERWQRSVAPARSTRKPAAVSPFAKQRPRAVTAEPDAEGTPLADGLPGWDITATVAAQARGKRPGTVAAPEATQLALDLGDTPQLRPHSGLDELSATERIHAELDALGLDVSAHVMAPYLPMLRDLGVIPARDLLTQRNRSEVLVAGVKVATQTPPVRSGRRVVFLTLDDSTGASDATFFEDVQGPYAATVFHSWLLLVRGQTRRTGPRGISLNASGAWELGEIHQAWLDGGVPGARAVMAAAEEHARSAALAAEQAVAAATESGVLTRRVLRHASGFAQSPYADTKPAGGGQLPSGVAPPRKLWHASPGSSGR